MSAIKSTSNYGERVQTSPTGDGLENQVIRGMKKAAEEKDAILKSPRFKALEIYEKREDIMDAYVYLCDMKRNCSEAAGCFKNGGRCQHTTDRDHARSGGFDIEEESGELVYPSNVEAVRSNDGSLFLVEREEAE